MRITLFKDQTQRNVQTKELSALLKSEHGIVWVDVPGPSEKGVELLRSTFEFHPLAIEDTRNQKQRPKAEEFSDHLFIILNPVTDDHNGELFRELDVFVGRNFVVTVHAEEEPLLDRVHARLEPGRSNFPVSATYLLYTLLDQVVDGYFPLLEKIEDELDELSSKLFSDPRHEILSHLFHLQQTLSQISRVLGPQQDVLNVLMNHRLVFIDQDSQYYLRDVSDHLLRITDTVRTLRDTVSSLLNLYISAVSYQLNRDVNRLTRLAVVVGSLTIISGFYGMNFVDTWPPFSAWWGVPVVLLLMLITVTYILVSLRRR